MAVNIDKETLEKAQEVFLKFVGEVIKKYRKKKNMNQTELGNYLGLSHSAIVRYEDGSGNITASQMAAISLILDFPMRRYIEIKKTSKQKPWDSPIPIDTIFYELIKEYETAQVKKEKSAIAEKPRISLTTSIRSGFISDFSSRQEKWEAKRAENEEKIQKKKQKRDAFLNKAAKENIELISMNFTRYFENAEPEKVELLYNTYEIVLQWRESNKRYDELPTALISAVLNYITTDDDKETEKMLKLYKKWLECTISKEMDD